MSLRDLLIYALEFGKLLLCLVATVLVVYALQFVLNGA